MPYRNLYQYKQYALQLDDNKSRGVIYQNGRITFLGCRSIAIPMFVSMCDSEEVTKEFEHYMSERQRAKERIAQQSDKPQNV